MKWLPEKKLHIAICFVCAAMVGAGYFIASSYKTKVNEAEQRQQLIDMTNAFTSAFASHRGDESLVPATFRRIGIEEFTDGVENGPDVRATASTMRMPGTPGLELNTIEKDTRIREIIGQMARSGTSTPYNEHVWTNGRYIGRTIIPSIATTESCVSCHNASLGSDIYEIGDIMGAFVVDTDLTESIFQSAQYAIATVPVVAALLFLIVAHQTKRSTKTVLALKRQVSAEQKQRKAEEQAKFLASHDALTKSANRSLFQGQLNRHLKAFDDQDVADVLVGVIDLDDFKLINDTFGHDAGDAVLCMVADRLRDSIEPLGGLVARFGGDEFAVLLAQNTDDLDAATLGETLVDALLKEFKYCQSTLHPTCSIGFALASQIEKTNVTDNSATDLMKAADVALYAAKEAGKSQARVFNKRLAEQMGRKRELAAALPNTLVKDGIRPVFQPKFSLQTGSIIGFEALARWTYEGKNIPPTEFIPLAEEGNIIALLDFHIMEEAARFVAEVSKEFVSEIELSVNASTMDLRNLDFVEHVLDVLMATGLSPKQLTIEITESVFMQNWAKARETLKALRKAGIKIALDDFGTGYSSLSYVLEFPFDEIKLDSSLARDVTTNAESRRMLLHLARMFQDLGKTVTIERIETWAQLQIMMEIGIHVAQGFHIAPPLEQDRARRLLTDLAEEQDIRLAS